MIIDVTRQTDGKYTFSVTVGTGTTKVYTDVIRGQNEPVLSKLYLQSHWGSGVKFTSAKVKKI